MKRKIYKSISKVDILRSVDWYVSGGNEATLITTKNGFLSQFLCIKKIFTTIQYNNKNGQNDWKQKIMKIKMPHNYLNHQTVEFNGKNCDCSAKVDHQFM